MGRQSSDNTEADVQSDRPPTYLELESVKVLPEAERMTTLSVDTLKRRYPDRIVRLSPRREGMKLRDILAIASGSQKKEAQGP
jgi:hypothetical protein